MAEDRQNVAETVRDIMMERCQVDWISLGDDAPALVTVPAGVRIEDVTQKVHEAEERLKPIRRRGHDALTSLDALIAWSRRFGWTPPRNDAGEAPSDSAVIFADAGANGFAPVMTAIANWHTPGIADLGGKDRTAMLGDHRGIYRFPVSEEWKRWSAIAGQQLDKDAMGEFIEENAKDILNPTPALLGNGKPSEDWEAGMIDVADKIDGRFASYRQLLEMSKKFAATESTRFKVHSNRDTGEALVEAETTHNDTSGAPIQVPNLFLIAIPVFDRGPLYRVAVRLRYRLRGGLSFSLAMYAPSVIERHAFDEAIATVREQTSLPILMGRV